MRARIWAALVWAAWIGVALAALGAGRSEASGLADDGRVGVVTDMQGSVLVQPAGRSRWSPVGPRTVLLPGDQVRTLPRGANAAEVRLAGGGSIVLGAGGLVRLDARSALHLVRGDAEIAALTDHPLRVTGPGGYDTSISDTRVLRAADAATTALDAAPRWLEGYRGSTTDEWLGSLVAQVDGRDVSLSVGYHKVDVVIRDQIAVTTIEESFVNGTSQTLEGVFSFPLPSGASISGFGMWIGDELVQADIVERGRARQIYEDIRRRRKDPGLLEWSGGNLFKASVFPIPAHGEKRIRVRYTQVLPLEGSRVRYRYPLRSELLRVNPLRRLQIRVSNHSSTPLVSASSPTHDVRVTRTDEAATVEFSADTYTPENDFEVVFGLGATAPLRVVPHRRGDDGYFMLLLAPPDPAAAGWTRALVPEGDPLDLLFVVDTSGSMGPRERDEQRRFVAALLALLAPADRFRMMACDAGVVWPVAEPLPVTDENVDAALAALERRFSLGWSDLLGAMTAAAAHADAGTHVIYVGDGIDTTGDADPVALAQRIERLDVPAAASFHAVATGSAFEAGVLDAIATLGGGSARGTEGDPARAAHALLTEVAQPPVRDLRVAIDGLRTARVYPERLPSLPAGTQQVVLGRFLPEPGVAEQRGRVTVTGRLGEKEVRYTAELTLAAEQDGNSFLPRLWARKHLDALLAEGRSPEIADEIVSFSERFGIMTPYTSFLVLENDADRERYGVTRRVHMRDGERFFAAARGAAATAKLREQVTKARSWRSGLRDRLLAEITDLGRSLHGGYAYGIGGGSSWDESVPGAASGIYRGPAGEIEDPIIKDAKVSDHNETDDAEQREEGEEAEWDNSIPPDSREPSDPPPPPEGGGPTTPGGDSFAGDDLEFASKKRPGRPGSGGWNDAYGFSSAAPSEELRRRDYGRGGNASWIGDLLFQRFPPVGPPVERPPVSQAPEWDEAVTAALDGVSQPLALAESVAGGVEVFWADGAVGASQLADGMRESFGRAVLGRERWFTTRRRVGSESYESWLVDERGALAAGTRLGRRRAGAAADRDDWGPFVGRHRADYVRAYANWSAVFEGEPAAADPVVVVRLAAPEASHADATRLTIDRDKRVLLRVDSLRDGKLVSSHRRADFVLAGALWWPTREWIVDARGDTVWEKSTTVRELDAAAFDAAIDAALADHADAIFVPATRPDVATAKQALHDGEATFIHHLVLAGHHASFQLWEEAWASWATARAAVEGKPGADWLELTLHSQSRLGEARAALARRMADALGGRDDVEARALVWQFDQLTAALSVDERLTLADSLARAGMQPADDPEVLWQRLRWDRSRAALLSHSGRRDAAISIWRRLWSERRDDPQAALDLMNALAQDGDVDGAVAVFDAGTFAAEGREHVVRQFFQQLAGVLWNALRFDEVERVAGLWLAAQPAEAQAHHVRLTAWLALDRSAECDEWVGRELAAADAGGGADDPEALARLNAAVSIALGDDWGGHWYSGQVDPRWAEPLIVVARRFALDADADAVLAARIISHHRLGPTDARRRLMEWLRSDLLAPGVIEDLPVHRLRQVLAWLPWDREHVDAAVWRVVADRVLTRWRGTTEAAERRVMIETALRLLDAHQESAEAIALLREALASDGPEDAPRTAGMLRRRLVAAGPWAPDLEDELLALVHRVPQPANQPAHAAQVFAAEARWLVDRLLALRIEAALGPVDEREALPRAELRRRHVEARSAARRELAERLRSASAAAPDGLRPWYEIERICLLAELGDDAVEGEAREMLLSVAAGDGDLDWVLRERSVRALSYFAVRRDAPEGLAERVLTLLEEQLEANEPALDWRYAIFRLLVVLNRPERLESALRSWIVPASVQSRWRIALGYVLAELERLDEAAAQFEAVADLGELLEPQYVALADWYLVLGDESARQSALERRYRVVGEGQLSNRLYQELSRLRGRSSDGVPADMDEEVLRVLRVLLGKSTRPGTQVRRVRDLYRATKDFRLLAPLADGIVGHSPGAVYAFLHQSASVIAEIHEEATCDELRARLVHRTESATTDTDRRGLALLLAQVERRAAETLDQPGPHADLALRFLRDARKGAWLPGERRLMADYLAALGAIPDSALAAEQVSQLRDLHAAEEPGTVDRLRVAFALHTTRWGYKLRDEAVDGLTAALGEIAAVHDGRLPASCNDVLDRLTTWYEELRRFAAGEARLLAELDRQPVGSQRGWLTQRLFNLYVSALHHGGRVSHGDGAESYAAVRKLMEHELAQGPSDAVTNMLELYCRLHREAHERPEVTGVVGDLETFSRTLFPEILPRFGQQRGRAQRDVAITLHTVGGAHRALTFLVEQLESEPSWLRRRGMHGWRSFSTQFAAWRYERRTSLGDLEPRAVLVVLHELERDLATEQSYGRSVYAGGRHRHFWKAKAADFAAVAERVIAEHPDSVGVQLHVARYQWGALALPDRAIDTLLAADERGVLAEDGRWTLVSWLTERKRWQECLPHAERLVAERPDTLHFRIVVVRALHGLDRLDEARAMVDAVRAHYDGLAGTRRANAGADFQLAQLCLELGYLTRAVDLYEAAIPTYARRVRGDRGGAGDRHLSRMYSSLAQAHTGLGQFDQAIDASSAAVVAMGSTVADQDQSLAALRGVLESIPDLAAWSATFEREAVATGTDVPVIRRALALIHLARKEPTPALHHLRAALRHAPDDAGLRAKIVTAHTLQGDMAGAAAAMAASLAHVPAQPDLYAALAGALRGLGDEAGAERALTGLVEMAPNEADGHRRLARVRTEAGRHADAVVQLQQVVRIRALELDGWLELARAQARAGDRPAAGATLDALLANAWAAPHRKAIEAVSRELAAD